MSQKETTVLIVDDDPGVLKSVQNIFEYNGWRTHAATSGEKALEIVADLESGVDLLVTDIVLPVMNGTELVKRFRLYSPHTKVLFMSGYMSPAISEEECAQKKKAFIQKPFIPRELIKMSERLLEGCEKEQFRSAKENF